ncbi:MAG: 50S ribosomal protein L35 [Chloroflexi bacterium CG_4_9_14_3_um_filter_45_9]|nr:MAG: 50S ribosomal protein L35 [Dehalococcoidia bacterium CG2_30_46_9]PIU22762.1 MAG: 50S ribosomal protein L35 [Chloroflexi bacterium CG08_land_8_20_14_0_20_45_12]PIX26956.1 MAG: 50S ribosomal protein L35 [Chloroflexi bacterium CG_4_8_14_3_um_filter_45_15]PJB49402.1 MAG: 50S ribosomal protein L35 [Chloroflexi bacterium CG_4_9_14_3_um_filter_45_9]
MPKLKTHKGAKSRFHVTGSGKIMRTKCGKSHLRRNKAPRTKRLYDELIPISTADKKRIKRLINSQ